MIRNELYINCCSGLPTPSPPASVSTSSPRPRLSASRSPTPRAVSPPRPKWNEPQKVLFPFFIRWGICRSTRGSGFHVRSCYYSGDNEIQCAWHAYARLALGHCAGRIERENSEMNKNGKSSLHSLPPVCILSQLPTLEVYLPLGIGLLDVINLVYSVTNST